MANSDEILIRTIFRASIDGPTPNSMQWKLGQILTKSGFIKVGTALYEGEFATPTDAMTAIQEGMKFLNSVDSKYSVDHLWIYSNTQESSNGSPTAADGSGQ